MPQILTGAAAMGQRHALRRRLVPGAIPTRGNLEITIKSNALLPEATETANGWETFPLDCEGLLALAPT